ncbi:MAG: peptidase [Verrucomicrobia bacterium]|nr:peptidase [Verrucomicrobiota bacterium]
MFPIFMAQAQPNTPRIGFVYPAGGRVGATIKIKVGGQFLQGVTNAFVTGDGIEAVVTDFNRPMPQGQFNKLRDRLQELREKRQASRKNDNPTNTWTTADEQEMTEMRDQILKNPPNRNATQAIADVATLRLTIATNAAPGEREIRLATATGLSNPMKFLVGALPEFSAPPARAPNPEEERLRRQFNLPPAELPSTNIARVTLPAVINGQIMPGEVDRYRFSARRGQSLVVAVSARDLIPYLADAVPGWFQATVALYDAKGKELAYDDDFRFQPDPVLHFEIPRDGDYFVEIKDSIYRGREDFVYRIALGELPFVTSIFPLGGRVGERTTVELKGWNLPTNTLMPETTSPGVTFLAARKGEEFSNRFPFAVEDWPEVREREPNNDSATAQQITAPIVVNGRIDEPGDADVFQITGATGDEIVAEVTARRLNSPLDSILKVLDASGQQLAINDDLEDKASGLNTHHADSYLRVKLPAAGKYFIHLGDTQRQGGPEFSYRLRVSTPQPDFELRAVPASLSVRPGNSAVLRVVALRKDGFTNDITVTLKDAPAGFKLSNNLILNGTNEVKLTLTAPFAAASEPFAISLVGRARVDVAELIRPVVPAEDQMQAFFYRHLVPAQELQVKVIRRPGALLRDQSR